MSRQGRRTKSQTKQAELDKPAYAADYPAQAEQKKPANESAGGGPLADALSSDLVGKLRQLKANLADNEAGTKKAPAGSAKKRKKAEPREEEESFAELFNPKDDDDSNSFADLLGESKLDWRKFK